MGHHFERKKTNKDLVEKIFKYLKKNPDQRSMIYQAILNPESEDSMETLERMEMKHKNSSTNRIQTLDELQGSQT